MGSLPGFTFENSLKEMFSQIRRIVGRVHQVRNKSYVVMLLLSGMGTLSSVQCVPFTLNLDIHSSDGWIKFLRGL